MLKITEISKVFWQVSLLACNLNLYASNQSISNSYFCNPYQLPNSIQNAAILMLTGQHLNRIALVREKHSGKWMLPGGSIVKNDASPFQAAKREFLEETGSKLPNIAPVLAFVYHGHTVIYLVPTKQKIATAVPFSKETDAIYFPQVKNLQNGVFSNKIGPLKYYAKNSLNEMFSIATEHVNNTSYQSRPSKQT